MEAKIILDTGLNPDLPLLVENARARFSKVKKVFVMPTIRLGLSGSRVYRVKIEEEKSPLPTLNYYAKIGSYERLKLEYESYKAYVDGGLNQVPQSWFTKQKNMHACPVLR